MGRRGPKPQPDAVKDQKAPVRSRQAKTIAAAQPKPALASLEAPSWLKGDALKIFQRMAPTLRDQKLLTVIDVPTFSRYCKNFARWLDLQKRLDQNGDIYEIETASGKVRRADPAFVMADRVERMLLAVEDRFGINPAERQRIMAARANTGTPGDLFSAGDAQKKSGDPATAAAPAAEPAEGPIGLLN